MRIAGITLPESKRIEIALTAIYGIGRSQAHYILRKANVDFGKKPKDISPTEENEIRRIIDTEVKIEGDLRRLIGGNVKRLKEIKAYRGTRHTRGLPSRGQRTRTNSRTRRGNVRKTMGTGRRKLEKK